MLAPLTIPANILDPMLRHCQQEAPLECCGVLGGQGRVVDSHYPLRNVMSSETRYEADPRDVILAVKELRARGAEFVAIYHSHPKWAAIPSKTDLSQNHYGDLPRIIVSLLADPPEVRVWKLDEESYEEIPWILAVEPETATG